MADEESIINIKGIFVDDETLGHHTFSRSHPSDSFTRLLEKVISSSKKPVFYASHRSYGKVLGYLERVDPSLFKQFKGLFSAIFPTQVELYSDAFIYYDINSEKSRQTSKPTYTLEMFLDLWNSALVKQSDLPQDSRIIQQLLLKSILSAKDKISPFDLLGVALAILVAGITTKNEDETMSRMFDEILILVERGFSNSIALLPLSDKDFGFAHKYYSINAENQDLNSGFGDFIEDPSSFAVAGIEDKLASPLLLGGFTFLAGIASTIFGQIRESESDDFSYRSLLSKVLERAMVSTVLDSLDGSLPLSKLYVSLLVQSYIPEGYIEKKLESFFFNNSQEIELFASSNIDDIAIENLIPVFTVSESPSRLPGEILSDPVESLEEPSVFPFDSAEEPLVFPIDFVEEPVSLPIEPLEKPVSFPIESVEESLATPKEIEPKKPLKPVDSVSKPVLVEADLDFSGGNNKLVIGEDFNPIRIDNFGGVGRGTVPDSKTLNELDTLKFEGDNFTVENIVFDQNGENLLISFSGLSSFFIELVSFKLELLDNIPFGYQDSQYIGNITFGGESTVSDSYDVVNSDAFLERPFDGNKLTVFNNLDNSISGQGDSNNIFHGQGGNDVLTGSSGDDTLRGGEGNDILNGGAGLNHLYGGPGKDKFVLNKNGFSRIYDFTSEELVSLPSNMSLKDVDIYSQGSSDPSNSDSLSTFISIRSTNKVIGEFVGVNPLSVNWESTIEFL